MSVNTIIDMIGWLGAITYLISYILVSIKKLEGDSFTFQYLNLIGGVCLIINTSYNAAYPATALNLAWVCIAIYTISNRKIQQWKQL